MAIATADITYQVQLDAMTPVKEVKGGYLTKGDVLAHTIHAACFEGDTEKTLENVSAVGQFVRADKTAVVLTGVITGNDVAVTLTSECYAIPGECHLIIRLVHSDTTKRTILWLKSMVLDTEYSDTVNPGTPLPDISDLLAAITQMNQASAAVASAVSEESAFNTRLTAAETGLTANTWRDLLLAEDIPQTTVAVTEITGGWRVTHTPKTGATWKRVDSITESGTTVTEVRQLYESNVLKTTLTITTNTTTMESEVTQT